MVLTGRLVVTVNPRTKLMRIKRTWRFLRSMVQYIFRFATHGIMHKYLPKFIKQSSCLKHI